HDAEARAAGGHELRDLLGDLRIIDRIFAVRAEVAHRMSLFPQVGFQLLLQLEAAVIGAESELERASRGRRSHVRWTGRTIAQGLVGGGEEEFRISRFE